MIAARISIINKYLTGTSRGPFRFPRKIFIIAVTNTSEPHFATTCETVLEKLWHDYGIANVIIITPCHGDPEVWEFDEFIEELICIS